MAPILAKSRFPNLSKTGDSRVQMHRPSEIVHGIRQVTPLSNFGGGFRHFTAVWLSKGHDEDSVPRPKQQELKLGQELEGVVVRTTSELTLVDLGYRQRGLLPPAKMGEEVPCRTIEKEFSLSFSFSFSL